MSKVELFIEARHRLGEAIIWHAANQCLYWIDLLDPALFRHDLKTAVTRSWPLLLPAPIGAIAATEDPDLLLLTHRQGLSLLRISNLALEPYCDPEDGRDAIIWNDAKCDRWGRIWAGSSHEFEKQPRGALWSVKDSRSFALGAMHAAWASAKTAKDVAMAGMHAGCEFDKNSGGPIDVYSVKLKV